MLNSIIQALDNSIGSIKTLTNKGYVILCLILVISSNKGFSKEYSYTFNEIETKAFSGDAYAQGLLSILYRTGTNIDHIDIKQSTLWATKSEKSGHPFGICNLGSLNILKGDALKANTYFQEAFLSGSLVRLASNNDPIASYCMGEIYFSSDPKDYINAIASYQRSADLNFPPATAALGSIYLLGIGTEQNTEKGIRLLEKAKRLNDASAHYNLGIAYSKGIGVKKDLAEAISLIQFAADRRFLPAAYAIGNSHLNGIGTSKDIEKGLHWLTMVAEQGFKPAVKALQQFESAIVQNNVIKNSTSSYVVTEPITTDHHSENKNSLLTLSGKAQYNIKENSGSYTQDSTRNLTDLQIEEHISRAKEYALFNSDYSNAISEYNKAAKAGSVEAIRELAIIYFKEDSVRDYEKSLELFSNSAQKGDGVSQRYLGMMYLGGHGVEQNKAIAKKWFTKASAQGDGSARRMLLIYF